MQSPLVLIRIMSILPLIVGTIVAQSEYQVMHDPRGSYGDVEERLLTEEIISTESFRPFLKKKGRKRARPTHPMLIVTLKSGLLAVFKEETHENYHYAEVAGYRASKALGLGLVPPTVFRAIERKKGSLQLYIDAPNLKKRELRNRIFSTLDPKTISDMKIFNYVFGRWDAHGGNELAVEVEGKYFVSLIDNSPLLHLTHQQYGEPAFISQGKNIPYPSEGRDVFPYDKAVKMKGPQTVPLFEPYMNEKRIRKYKKPGSITYVMWHNRVYIRFTSHSISRFTHEISFSTLQALQSLTYEDMYEVWREFHEVSPEHAEDLIHLTLERRDNVLKYFQNSGIVLRD
jgi:hypothetical protein